ncbi:2-vinyl bacteriochlorophyllide hydratase [Candidatus Chlorohelix sp.]|uniref:2-vinyl bacteriochlorophyllide hydratase n=1 Tax=Candidatus Chlorohelix sp. TaxID=3139201 RepID=UPI003074DE7E
MNRYTTEQMERKAKSKWTIVQYIGAPIQILILFISLGFVIYTLTTDKLFDITNFTIIFKTAFLYFMFITGMFWEKEVIGAYYLSREFFWEDVVSTIVLILHTAYVIALITNLDHKALLILILVAYFTVLVNAIQYLVKALKNRANKQLIPAMLQD